MESRYGLLSGLFMTLCVVLIIGAVYRGCSSQAPPSAQLQIAGYDQRFCEDTSLTDHSASNPEEITVQLRDGCFGNHTKLPRAWNTWFVQKSRHPDDWAAVWCEGSALPSPPYPYTEGMGTSFNQCRDQREFFLEGRGTITFRRTSVNPESAAQANGAASASRSPSGQEVRDAEGESAKKYTITPMSPEGGNPPDYTFLLKQCYRASEKITCWGLITLTSDAPRHTTFYDSRAIDDEGNSISIGTFGGNFTFEGSGDQQKLLPGVPAKFVITVPDPHQNVKSITLDLNVHGGEENRSDQLIFKDVPVQ
jgi:hypothetical protein